MEENNNNKDNIKLKKELNDKEKKKRNTLAYKKIEGLVGGKGGRPRKDGFEINLFPVQKKIYDETFNKRFIFVQAGRRGGKTTLSKKTILDKAMRSPNSIIWYVAPTIKDAKELIAPFLNALPKKILKSKSETAGVYKLVNGSVICIKGSDRMDNLRGRGIDYVVLEEFSFHKRGVWDEVIRPQLSDRRGGALFIGTPSMKKGSQFRRLAEYAKSGKDKDWTFFNYSIYDNPYISKDEIECIKNSTNEIVWTQEYLAQFVETEGVVYYEFNDKKNVFHKTLSFKDYENMICVEGIDWGLADYTACVWIYIYPDGRLVVGKEYSKNNMAIVDQVRGILEKRGKSNVAYSVLDETAFRRDPTSLTSVGTEFKKYGIPCHPSIKNEKEAGIMLLKKYFMAVGNAPFLNEGRKLRI